MRYFGIFVAGLALVFLFSQLAQLNPAISRKSSIELEVLSAANAAELQQIARYGNGTLSGAIDRSPETETIAAGTSLGIWLYSPSQPQDARFLDLDTKVFDLIFLNDGQFLAYSTFTSTTVVELATGLEVMSFPEFHVIAAHANDDYLLINKNNIVEEEYGSFNQPEPELWNIRTGELLENFALPTDYAYFQGLSITDIEASQDGRFVAASYSTGIEDRNSFVILWDNTKPQEEPFVLSGAEYVEFSNDSHFLVSKEFDSWLGDIPMLRILNLVTHEEQLLDTMPGDADSWGISVRWFGFEPSSGQLLTLTDGILRYWTLADMQMQDKIELGIDIKTIVLGKDNRKFSTEGNNILLWDNSFQNEESIPFQSALTDAEFWVSGNGVSYLDENKRIHLQRINENLELVEFFVSNPLPESPYPPLLSPNAEYLAYEDNGIVRLIPTTDNQILVEIENASFPLAFSDDGNRLILEHFERIDELSSRNYFQVWDIPSATLLREFGPYEQVDANRASSQAQFSADGESLGIKFQLDYTQRQYIVYSITTGQEIYSYELNGAYAYASWTPDLRDLIVTDGDFDYSTSRFVNPLVSNSDTEEFHYPYAGHVSDINQETSAVFFITSSHTGCGGDFRQLYVHHIPDMQVLWTRGLPMGGYDTIDNLLNPTGDLVFTVDSVVDASTGDLLFQLPYGAYPSAAFSSDRRFFLTNQEGVIRLWAVLDENNGE